MNGHLTAHSDGPGQGALFTLQIPLISVTENA
jgi:signal transduction histidine kinase